MKSTIVGTFSLTHVSECDTDSGTRQAIDNSRAGDILLWFRGVSEGRFTHFFSVKLIRTNSICTVHFAKSKQKAFPVL